MRKTFELLSPSVLQESRIWRLGDFDLSGYRPRLALGSASASPLVGRSALVRENKPAASVVVMFPLENHEVHTQSSFPPRPPLKDT